MGNYKQDHGLQVHVMLILPGSCRNDFPNTPHPIARPSPQLPPKQAATPRPPAPPAHPAFPCQTENSCAQDNNQTRGNTFKMFPWLGVQNRTRGQVFQQALAARQLALPPQEEQQLGRAAGTRGVPGHAGASAVPVPALLLRRNASPLPHPFPEREAGYPHS